MLQATTRFRSVQLLLQLLRGDRDQFGVEGLRITTISHPHLVFLRKYRLKRQFVPAHQKADVSSDERLRDADHLRRGLPPQRLWRRRYSQTLQHLLRQQLQHSIARENECRGHREQLVLALVGASALQRQQRIRSQMRLRVGQNGLPLLPRDLPRCDRQELATSESGHSIPQYIRQTDGMRPAPCLGKEGIAQRTHELRLGDELARSLRVLAQNWKRVIVVADRGNFVCIRIDAGYMHVVANLFRNRSSVSCNAAFLLPFVRKALNGHALV